MIARRNERIATGLALALVIMLAMLAPATAGPPSEPRKSNAAGVQVVVTPKPDGKAGNTWDFEVVMDTHTKPLSDDLVRASVLIVDGRTYAPLEWQGDRPGGHHRKGTLRFPRPAEISKVIEVRINGVGGVETRTFRWDSK